MSGPPGPTTPAVCAAANRPNAPADSRTLAMTSSAQINTLRGMRAAKNIELLYTAGVGALQSPPRLRAFSVLRWMFLLALYGASLAAAGVYFAVVTLNRELPATMTQLLEYQPSRKSLVFSRDGERVGEFSQENRKHTPLDRMPAHLPAAFLSAEDRRFYQHSGFDIFGIARAAIANFRGTGIRQGGSTLTQQIIKQTLLADEEHLQLEGLPQSVAAALQKQAKYKRKMKELILAVRLERELTKSDILSIYLDHVYLGNGAYGVGAAAEAYFGKDVADLTIAEAALLAGLVASPSRYAPTVNIKFARERQHYVLRNMREDAYISQGQYEAALAEPLALVARADLNNMASPWFVEHLRRLVQDRYTTKRVFTGGMRMYATIDQPMQAAAEAAVAQGLLALDRRLGFRGPVGQLTTSASLTAWARAPHLLRDGRSLDDAAPTTEVVAAARYGGVVTELRRDGGVLLALGERVLPLDAADAKQVRAWRDPAAPKRQIAVHDVLPVVLNEDGKGLRLAQRPTVEAALVAMEPSTGRVLALVGGFDASSSKFNRATQARRQVGSSIKPFIYGSAIEAGRTAVERMVDHPVAVPTATGVWTPANYDNRYIGPVSLQNALALSLNTISVQLVMSVGVERIIEVLKGFGVTSPLQRHVSLALGTPDITLLEMAAAYAGLANGGRQVTPRFLDLVTETTGDIVEDFRHTPPGPQVFSPEVAYITTFLMKGVVNRGTAKAAMVLGRPAAGKTGTSANYRDVWFVGFTADLLCAVWVGRDDSKPIGDKITGGAAAVPIWVDFMRHAHPATPIRDFPIPPGIVFARGDAWSGAPVGPSAQASWVPFVAGTMPPQFIPERSLSSFQAASSAAPRNTPATVAP